MSEIDGKQSLSGAEALVKMLEAFSVDTIFGLCGDTTLPFYDAMARLDHGISHFLTRDERHAAYMADAYARISGKVGVCEGPSGGGATYIAPGIVEANDSSVPVLAITTDVATTSRGKFPLTELDQRALFAPLSKFNDMLDDSATLPAQIRNTFEQMTTGRPGSAHLGLPFDTQKGLVDIDEVWADPQFGQYPACRRSANEQEAEKLLNLLIDAEQPIIICGGGVVLSGAEAELKVLAHNLDIPVATTVSGQGSLAETDSLCVGVVGSNGGVVQTRKLVEEADLVFFIGCRAGSVTTERWRVPSTSKRIVHLDNDEKVLNAIYKTEVALYCDALLGLQTINALWGDRQSLIRNSADKVSAVVAEKFAIFNQIANQDSRPVRPERVVSELQSILPDDVIICVDPGTPCPYFSAYYQWQRPGRHFIANRAHGALGFALAAAMGAHVAAPEKTVIAAMGDGSFGFCCGEFETLLRYNIPITIIVFSNSGYGWIKAGQKTSFESRFHNVDFSCTDHAAVARAFGMQAWTVDDPTQLRSSLEAAIACEGPTLVDVISQPLQEANAPVSEWIS